MPTDPEKPVKPIPATRVLYHVKRSNEKELRRILGRDLVEAEKKGKPR